MQVPTCPVLLIVGEFDMLANRAWAKSRILKWLCDDFDQSESYPKLWTRTFLKPGSAGNHCSGQYVDTSSG